MARGFAERLTEASASRVSVRHGTAVLDSLSYTSNANYQLRYIVISIRIFVPVVVNRHFACITPRVTVNRPGRFTDMELTYIDAVDQKYSPANSQQISVNLQ